MLLLSSCSLFIKTAEYILSFEKPQFIHFLVDMHSGYFQFSSIANSAALNILICISLYIYLRISLGVDFWVIEHEHLQFHLLSIHTPISHI